MTCKSQKNYNKKAEAFTEIGMLQLFYFNDILYLSSFVARSPARETVKKYPLK